MSWTASGTVNDAAGAAAVAPANEGWAYEDEVHSQVHSAQEVAKAIIESGCVGAGPYNVSLVGHANPGHEFRAGYATDSVTVTVTQVYPESVISA